MASGIAREDPAQVMRHSEEGKAGYLDLGVFMLAADDGGEGACGRGGRIWGQWGSGGGWRASLLRLHPTLRRLFELGKGGQQALCWLDRAGGVAAVRQKLLD